MTNKENVFKSSPNVCAVGVIKTVANVATLAISLNGLKKKEYAAEDSIILSLRDLTNWGLQIPQTLLTRRRWKQRQESGPPTQQNFLEKLYIFYKDIENHKNIDNFLQNLNVDEGNVYDLRKNIKSKSMWNKTCNNGYNYTILDSIYENHFTHNSPGNSNEIKTLLQKNIYINTCRRIEDENSAKIYNLKEFTMLSIPSRQNSIEYIFSLFNNCVHKKLDLNNVFYIGDLNQNLENVYYLKDNIWSYPCNNALLPDELNKSYLLTTIYYQLAGSKKDRDNVFKDITKDKLESINDKNFIEIGEFSNLDNTLFFGLERLIFAAMN